jgi:hypothetical protein
VLVAFESETPTNQSDKACHIVSSENESEPGVVQVAAPKQTGTRSTLTGATDEVNTSSTVIVDDRSENPKQTNTPRVEDDRRGAPAATAAVPSNNEPLHGYNMQT